MKKAATPVALCLSLSRRALTGGVRLVPARDRNLISDPEP